MFVSLPQDAVYKPSGPSRPLAIAGGAAASSAPAAGSDIPLEDEPGIQSAKLCQLTLSPRQPFSSPAVGTDGPDRARDMGLGQVDPAAAAAARARAGLGDMHFFQIVDRSLTKSHTFQGDMVSLLSHDSVICKLSCASCTDGGDVISLQPEGFPHLCHLATAIKKLSWGSHSHDDDSDDNLRLWILPQTGASVPCIEASLQQKQDLFAWFLGNVLTAIRGQANPATDDLMQLDQAHRTAGSRGMTG